MPSEKDMSTTLSDNATNEEISDFVQSKLGGNQEETGETSDTEETTADVAEDEDTTTGDEDNDAGDDDTAVDDGEETTSEESVEEDSWIDDDTRGLAAAFELTDEQLSEMSGRDELERHLRLLDSRAMAKADGHDEQQVERHPDHPDRRPDGTLLPKEQRQAQEEPQPKTSEFKIELDPEMHDPEVIETFNGLSDHYESRLQAVQSESERRIAALESAEQSRAVQAFENQFDAMVDLLGMTELFGETGKETNEQMQRRETAMHEFLVRRQVHASQGRKIELNKPILDYVARRTFAEHFAKQDRKALTRKAQRQAGLKMGQSTSMPSNPKESLRDKFRREYRELDEG